MTDIARLGIQIDTSGSPRPPPKTREAHDLGVDAAGGGRERGGGSDQNAIENAKLATAKARAGEALQRKRGGGAGSRRQSPKPPRRARKQLQRQPGRRRPNTARRPIAGRPQRPSGRPSATEQQAPSCSGWAAARDLRGGFRLAQSAVAGFMGALAISRLIEGHHDPAAGDDDPQFVTGSGRGGRAEFNTFRIGRQARALDRGHRWRLCLLPAAIKAGGLTVEQSRGSSRACRRRFCARADLGDGQRALYALQQMVSKGTVQAEELRQQLGEALPGAVQFAAQADGDVRRAIHKAMEQGEVAAIEFVTRFGDLL